MSFCFERQSGPPEVPLVSNRVGSSSKTWLRPSKKDVGKSRVEKESFSLGPDPHTPVEVGREKQGVRT